MMIEKLEQRKLLSTSTLTGGVLTVQLENTGGNVVIQESANSGAGNTVLVNDVNGATFTNFSGVNMIRVLGGAGDDQILVISQNVKLFINGGAGNDTIGVQINPVDSFTGDGINTPVVYGVLNPSYTGTGSIISGGDGNDQIIVAGLSNSVVMGGAGSDFVVVGGTFASFTDIHGNAVVDAISGGSHMVVAGDAGDDIISSGFGSGAFVAIPGLTDSIILGGTGNDTITDITDTTTDGNIINGGPGDDVITVSITSNTMVVGNTHGDVVTSVL